MIEKSLSLTQTLLQEGFKFFLDNKNVSLIFYFILVLLLLKQNFCFEKNSDKQFIILARNFDGGKIVFTLLDEGITLCVLFTLILIKSPSL